MPNILLNGHVAIQLKAYLQELLGNSCELFVWDDEQHSSHDFFLYSKDVDVIVGGAIPTDFLPNLEKLLLYQIPWAGYEFCSPKFMPLNVPVCNCYEHETVISEFVLSGILEFQIGLLHMNQRFRNLGWDKKRPGSFTCHGELRGKTLGILGFGRIGKEVAKRAKAFDMNIIGIMRNLKKKFKCLDQVVHSSLLHEVLPRLDFIVIACDLNESTLGIIDKFAFDRMKKTAVIINVARGKIINEKDLFEALKNMKIRGALIDVWYKYVDKNNNSPEPSNYPFHKLDNVIMTGHESAAVKELFERRAQFISGNIKRVLSGERPQNLLFYGQCNRGADLNPLSEFNL